MCLTDNTSAAIFTVFVVDYLHTFAAEVRLVADIRHHNSESDLGSRSTHFGRPHGLLSRPYSSSQGTHHFSTDPLSWPVNVSYIGASILYSTTT